ncbi:MAG TPA: tetratricopeptide repeat protein [Longimicrobium sp.]|nr:tetratricopeptide repeat protein [Longimicrobium sp.]
MSSRRRPSRPDRPEHGVPAEPASLGSDLSRCLGPMVSRYWKGALAAIAGAGTVLALIEPPKWVVQAVGWAAVLGFFVALAATWVQCRPQVQPSRRRFALVLAALILPPILLGGGLVYAEWLIPEPPPREASLALLTSMDDELSNGFAEELRSHLLSAEAGVQVILADKRGYETQGLSMPQIGKALQTAHVLELVPRPAGTRLMADVRLWDTRGDRMMWAERYEGTGDIFQLQRQIAEQIVDELGVRLSRAQRARLAAAPTANDSAYHLYLKGRGLVYVPRRTLEGNEEAIGHFRAALRLDPGFGLAHAGLARGYGVRGQLTGDRAWNDSAIAAARRAVALAPKDERTHATLGVTLRETGRFEDALAALREAEAHGPKGGDGSGRSNLGIVMLEQGYLQQSIAYGEQAVEIEPRSPTAQWRLGLAYEVLGDDPRAERAYRAAVAAAPNAPDARFRLAMLYWVRDEAERGDPEVRGFTSEQGECLAFQWEALTGRPDRARERARAQGRRAWRCAPVLLGFVHLRLGDAALARAALDTAAAAARDSIEHGHDGSHPRLVLAQVHALRGDPGEANRWFAEAVERGYRHVRAARRLPTLEGLRATPEFRNSLAAMDGSVTRQREQIRQTRDTAAANRTQ